MIPDFTSLMQERYAGYQAAYGPGAAASTWEQIIALAKTTSSAEELIAQLVGAAPHPVELMSNGPWQMGLEVALEVAYPQERWSDHYARCKALYAERRAQIR